VNTPVKLGAFAVALVAVFGAGAGLGAAVGPDAADDATGVASRPGEAEGYALVPATDVVDAGDQTVRFRITDPEGDVVSGYEVDHEKELHLIVVSTDLVSFQHVHPVRDTAGWWSVELTGLQPGALRLYADFTVEGGPSLVLEHDLTVTGTPPTRSVPEPATVTEVDGLTVTLDAGELSVGESPATLRVTRAGRAVALERYLGAGGHLVAISADELSYLHVHPTGDDLGGGEVAFALAMPETGRHRLFFDFQVDGVVRTAAFTVDVRDDGAHGGASDGEPEEQGHGH
jgi:hypothetical protein